MTYDILSILAGRHISSPSDILIQGFTSANTGKSVTGALLKVDTAHSICEGLVVYVGKETDNQFVVMVEYSPSKWIRYCNLNSVSVKTNQKVGQNDIIGSCYKNTLRFEYCNLQQSNHIVRISNITCYKHDPLGILYGLEVLPSTPLTVYAPSETMKVVSEIPLNNYANSLNSIINAPGR